MAVAVKAQTIPNTPTKIARATISQIKNSWATLTTKQGDKVSPCHQNIQNTASRNKLPTVIRCACCQCQCEKKQENNRGLWPEDRSAS